MTHTQRLKAMLAGEKLARPCAALWGPHMNIEDRHPKDFARAIIGYQKAFEFDFIKVMANTFYLTEDFGQVVRWGQSMRDDSFRNLVKPAVRDPSEWEKLKPLDPKKGALAREVEVIKYLSDYFKGEVPILATIFSALVWAQYLTSGLIPYPFIGQMEHYPNQVKKGLAVIQETNLALAEEYLKAGAAGFFYAQHLGENHLTTKEIFDEFARPVDIEFFNETKDKAWFNMLHMHGANDLLLDSVLDYPATAINWEDRSPANPSIADMAKQTDMVMVAGLNNRNEFRGTSREEIKARISERVRDAIAQAGDKRLVISGGCSWDHEDPPRFHILTEVLDEIEAGK